MADLALDTLAYVRRMEAAGITRQQAEALAQEHVRLNHRGSAPLIPSGHLISTRALVLIMDLGLAIVVASSLVAFGMSLSLR